MPNRLSLFQPYAPDLLISRRLFAVRQQSDRVLDQCIERRVLLDEMQIMIGAIDRLERVINNQIDAIGGKR